MGGAQRFEDLVAWQLTREVTKNIYAITREPAFTRDRALVDQMRRAAISVMSNLAEGFERETNPDRLRFYSTANSSCAELRAQMYIAFDAEYIDEPTFQTLREKAERVARVIGGLRAAIARTAASHNGRS